MCYKMLHHVADIHQDDVLTISHVKITRGNSFKLIVPNSRADARANFFSVRIIIVLGYRTKLLIPPAFHHFTKNL